MGWCGATGIFDDVMDAVIDYIPEDKLEEVAEKVAKPLWDSDWDCESESAYFDTLLTPIMFRLGYMSKHEYDWRTAGCPDDWDWENKPF